jgi:site-specific recombinase XerD
MTTTKGIRALNNQARAYLSDYRGVYAETTFTEITRRLRRINEEITRLGLPADYSAITPEQIRIYAVFIRSKKISQKALAYDLSTLGKICVYYGNDCVDRAKAKYPLIFHVPPKSKLPPLANNEISELIAKISAIKAPYKSVRAGAITMLVLGAGLRTIEARYAEVAKLNTRKWTILLQRVKGSGTYGQSREIPILPEVRPYILYFLSLRAHQPPTVAESRYIFASPIDGLPLSSNTLRLDKDRLIKRIGIDYDYRKLRRTYGQILVDSGADIQAVSMVMGHASTRTTEAYYARLRADYALADILTIFENEKKEVV